MCGLFESGRFTQVLLYRLLKCISRIVVNSGKRVDGLSDYRHTCKSSTVPVDVWKTDRLKAMEVTIIYITAN